MAPMHKMVKVKIYFQSLTIEINNFAFEVKVILGLKSTIPDGRPGGWLAGRRSWEQNQHSPAGTGIGAELGNKTKREPLRIARIKKIQVRVPKIELLAQILPSSTPVPAPTGLQLVLLSASPTGQQAGRQSIRNSTFQPEFSFDFKSKVVRPNGQTPEMTSDLNPISQGGQLTLFQPNGYLDEYLPILI